MTCHDCQTPIYATPDGFANAAGRTHGSDQHRHGPRPEPATTHRRRTTMTAARVMAVGS